MSWFNKIAVVIFSLLLSSCNKTLLQHDGIEVFGSGRVDYFPNNIFLAITIENDGEDIKNIMEKTNNTYNSLLDIFREYNLSEKYFQSNISIPLKNKEEKKSQYYSFKTIYIEIEKSKNIEEFLEKLLSNGDVDVQVYYSSTNLHEYEREAELIALENAKKSAERIASDVGIKLGKIKYVEMSSWDNARPTASDYELWKNDDWKRTIVRNVTVGYEIK
jgi:uncharacterized protein YggE